MREHAVDVPHRLTQITHVTETLQPSRRQITVTMATPASKGKNTVIAVKLVTVRNNNSGKVMFLHLAVILFTGAGLGGCLPRGGCLPGGVSLGGCLPGESAKRGLPRGVCQGGLPRGSA